MDGATLQDILWTDVEKMKTLRIYCLQDAAADPCIHPNLVLSAMDRTCLYEGRLPSALEHAAPYLVRLPALSPYTRWYLGRSWGRGWGIFLQSEANLMELRAHFRRLLLVRGEGGSRYLFRFFDPRVLRAYFPTCTLEEQRDFLGPVALFFCESENGSECLEFGKRGGVMRMTHIRPHHGSKARAIESSEHG
jgi:hypothetical protein